MNAPARTTRTALTAGPTSPNGPSTAAALHRASCLLALGLAGLCMAAHGAAPARPPAGSDVDETRQVAQRTQAPQDCLSVVLGGVTVLLDRAELSRQASARPAQWKTEAERMALIEGRRAAALLQAAAPDKDSRQDLRQGCHQVTQVLDGEDQFVVLAHLERGAATVLPAGSTQPAPAVAIRYLGARCGPACGRGSISVQVPGQPRPFMATHWWGS